MNLEETKSIVSKIFNCSWVKWIHEGTKPADNNFKKTLNAVVGTILPVHCAQCLNLNGCCFVKEKAPLNPLHERCHCKLMYNEKTDSENLLFEMNKEYIKSGAEILTAASINKLCTTSSI